MSTCMYKMRPLLNHDEPLPKPTHNMYPIKPMHNFMVNTSSDTVRLSELNGCIQEIIKESQGDIVSLEKRQEEILQRLAQLKLDMKNLRAELNASSAASVNVSVNNSSLSRLEPSKSHDIVVYASPLHPPYSLLALSKLWGTAFPVKMHNHTHSSVKEAPAEADLFKHSVVNNTSLSITLIWKDVGPETELIINPIKYSAIRGETNILRYLSRVGPSNFAYENDNDIIRITEVDKVLDFCQRLARHTTVKEKQAVIRSINACLGKSQWMCGRPQLSLSDVAVWSVFKQLGSSAELTQSLKKWMERCETLLL